MFASDKLPALQLAVRDLSWLLTKGYASPSSLKMVGDRYCLDARQRLAIARCACGDLNVARRRRHQVAPATFGQQEIVQQQEIWIDGYNVLTSVEAALSNAVILHARDGSYRDMASMHGSYRKVDETIPALELLGEVLAEWSVAGCNWLLDQPVSNSGRLKTIIQEIGDQHGWQWRAELVPDPDPVLAQSNEIVASADSQILDKAERWLNLARIAIDSRVTDAWIIDLSG